LFVKDMWVLFATKEMWVVDPVKKWTKLLVFLTNTCSAACAATSIFVYLL